MRIDHRSVISSFADDAERHYGACQNEPRWIKILYPMAKKSLSSEITEALRRRGNPYAKLEVLYQEDDPPSPATQTLSEAERSYIRLLGDPYAVLSIADEVVESEESISLPMQTTAAAAKTPVVGKVTQREFESECRRIFRQYIPAAENGRIRPRHRAFVERNLSSSPEARYLLMEGLRRYDLSGIAGVQVQFNRERDEFTAAKLTSLEASVSKQKR